MKNHALAISLYSFILLWNYEYFKVDFMGTPPTQNYILNELWNFIFILIHESLPMKLHPPVPVQKCHPLKIYPHKFK